MSWLETGREEAVVKRPLESFEGKLADLTNEEYHVRPEFSSSDIKHAIKSPAHFKANVIDKHLRVKEPSGSFDLGSSAHDVFLEQTTERFVSLPGDLDRRTKLGKEQYDSFLLANAGKRILPADQYSRVLEMFGVISSNEEASRYVSEPGSEVEQSYVYVDEETGLLCKFRPDIININKGYIVDYKTAISASPYEFAKAIPRYYYHVSCAHYVVGAERLFDKSFRNYSYLVQEKEAPFAIGIYHMTPEDIGRSIKMRSAIMKRIKHSIDTNSWRDYSAKPQALPLPGYAFEFKETQ